MIETRNCLRCNKPFQFRVSPSREGRGKYCSRSCGISVQQTKHGHTTHTSASKTYNTWANMRNRCSNPNHPKFPMYGGSGISVCASWGVFENFLADMGERPIGTSIDRIDGTKGYSPENCRWATPKIQQTNIRSNIFLEFQGSRLCISEWSRLTGIDHGVIRYRIKRGYTIEQALTIKPKHGNRLVKTKRVLLLAV